MPFVSGLVLAAAVDLDGLHVVENHAFGTWEDYRAIVAQPTTSSPSIRQAS
jgi:hypothetical protein